MKPINKYPTDLKFVKEDLIEKLRYVYEHEENMDLDDLKTQFVLIIQVMEDNNLLSVIERGKLNREFKELLEYLEEYY